MTQTQCNEQLRLLVVKSSTPLCGHLGKRPWNDSLKPVDIVEQAD